MTTGRILAMGTAALMSVGHAAVGQSFGDWNRKITDFSMTASINVLFFTVPLLFQCLLTYVNSF